MGRLCFWYKACEKKKLYLLGLLDVFYASFKKGGGTHTTVHTLDKAGVELPLFFLYLSGAIYDDAAYF